MRRRTNSLHTFFRNMDFWLMAFTVLATIFGIIMISSAGGENSIKYVIVQFVALIIGIIGICALMILDYEYLAKISNYLSGFALLLLVIVLIPGIGKVQNGARSWFVFGPISLQPAEIGKIVYIIALSKMLSNNERNINDFKTVIKIVGLSLIPIVLILLQPDFGTASVFFFVLIVTMFTAGLNWKYFAGGGVLLAAACPIAWKFILHDYQKQRILTLFNPEADPTGSGYQVIQSKLAVGSGRLFGSGLYKGPSQFNNMLPERHTDFIYSVVCEELGMVGACLVIILISAIIIRSIYIAYISRNALGKYMCVGVASMLLFQSFENIGMCIGILPVTGITLPFFSYGGSSLLTTLISIGLVINVKYRCRMINF